MISKQFTTDILAMLKYCRPGDDTHALRVVKWTEELSANNSNKERIIKAAYVHDLGWYHVLPSNQKLTKDELKQFEPIANKQSATIISNFLSKHGEINSEITEILKLVKAADLHESHNNDEAIIVDADNLSKLTIDHVAEKYRPSDWMKMWTLWNEEFPKRIQTEKGKLLYPKLLLQLKIDKQI
jgi:HD superfamily phosphodiesterase